MPQPKSKEHAAAESVRAMLAADAELAAALLPRLYTPTAQDSLLIADAAGNELAVAVEVGTLLPEDSAQRGAPSPGRCLARVNIWIFVRRELGFTAAEDDTHDRVCAVQDAVISALMRGYCNTTATAVQAAELVEVMEVDNTGTKLENMDGRVIALHIPIFYT